MPGAPGSQPKPKLIVVSGAPGSGKTTLAHRLAAAIPCPALCRDEIREGMVHTHRPESHQDDRALTLRAYDAFFGLAELMVANQVSVVLEAAFQHRLWAEGLQPLLGRAELRVVRCVVDTETARQRMRRRINEDPGRLAHNDIAFLDAVEAGEISLERWEPLHLDVPSLVASTNDGYAPGFEEIIVFARA